MTCVCQQTVILFLGAEIGAVLLEAANGAKEPAADTRGETPAEGCF